MNILITGGNGQLGRAFSQIWPEAKIIDRLELDMTGGRDQISASLKQYEPDVVINCGAYTSVDQAELEPELAMQINGTAVESMVAASEAMKAWFIQLSTDYVLSPRAPGGAIVRQPDEPPAPANQYGRSKLKGEQATLAYVRGRVIRTSWVFGEGKNFVHTMVELSKTRDELSVVNDQIGRPTYAPDLAQAIKSLVTNNKLAQMPPITHIQNDGPAVSWADFAAAIMEDIGSKTNIKGVSTAEFSVGKFPYAERPDLSVFDLSPLEGLGVTMPDWRQSLKSYLANTN